MPKLSAINIVPQKLEDMQICASRVNVREENVSSNQLTHRHNSS